MSTTTRPPPRDGRPAPEGYRYVAVRADRWRAYPEPTGRCRFLTRQRGCGEPAVARLYRPHRRGQKAGTWWLYCRDHLYDRWIEDGRVMEWIIEPDVEEDGDG